jgi:hypothetical protein
MPAAPKEKPLLFSLMAAFFIFLYPIAILLVCIALVIITDESVLSSFHKFQIWHRNMKSKFWPEKRIMISKGGSRGRDMRPAA